MGLEGLRVLVEAPQPARRLAGTGRRHRRLSLGAVRRSAVRRSASGGSEDEGQVAFCRDPLDARGGAGGPQVGARWSAGEKFYW